MDVDIGHLPPQMPLICGSMAKVTVKGDRLDLTMELK
jgi:muramoyltetrapeptide carboxypeptidase LdcA involved in peptidoglycan recycling